jgi:hypothetical protein
MGSHWGEGGRTMFARFAAVALLVALGACSPRGTGTPAPSASTQGPPVWTGPGTWMEVAEAGHGTSLNEVVATGPRDAWAVGRLEEPALKRWNGTGWHDVTIPGGPKSPAALSASSSRDVWVFGSDGDAWRWNGRTWSSQDRPAGTHLSAAVVAGPGQVWLAESADAAYINRWSRGGWTRVALFSAIALPSPYVIQRPTADHLGLELLNVAAGSAREVWVAGSSGGWWSTPGVAFRWDGHRFAAVALPRGTMQITAVEGDGHGGLWTADGHPSRLRHYDGRHWTGERNPSGLGLGVRLCPTSPACLETIE